MSGAICAHLSLKNWVQSQPNPPKMTQKVTFSYFSILEFWVIFNLQLCLTRWNLLFLTNFQHIRPRKMTQGWKMVKKMTFLVIFWGGWPSFDPILCLHYTNIDIWSKFWTPCMPLNTSFFISDQFLAYETMKNDSKLKNGEKWLFGSFILGSADFGPIFLVSHARNWSKTQITPLETCRGFKIHPKCLY